MKRIAIVLFLGCLVMSCSGHKAPKAVPPPPSPAKKSEAKPVSEVDKMLAEIEKLYMAGEKNYREGHLNSAKQDFDNTVISLLDARTKYPNDPRIAKTFDTYVENIHNFELDSIEEGDAFAAEAVEPALIDKLKDIPFFQPTKESMQKEEQYKAEASGMEFDLPVVINDKVMALIEAFQNERRYEFQRGLNRSGIYIDMLRRQLKEEKVPQDLVYAALVESGYNPKAYSVARAKGIWQFIEGTGRRYGLKSDWWVDERSDPEKATKAAAAYLRDLYSMFGDWYLALAAYNAGERKVLNAINRTGKNDFWEISKTPYLKEQTKNYVPAILAAAIISRNPEKFGFTPVASSPVAFEKVAINRFTDLRVIADVCGCSYDAILSLNPELRRNLVPGSVTLPYQLRIPPGNSEAVLARISTLPTARLATYRNYTVHKGDTLNRIAKRYGVPADQLAEANNVASNDYLRPGMRLLIPTGRTYYTYSRKVKSSSNPNSSSDVHIVRSGDTLFSISSKYNLDPDQIQRMNNLSSKTIYPGQRLIIAGKNHTSDSDNSSNKKIVYIIRKGDTLFKISQQHGVSIDKICSWNNISKSRHLIPGDTITIYRDQ
jgi:peptidoglycan lytic transglycosylase D